MRVNLLHAHGSPTNYWYTERGCRCTPCRAAKSAYQATHYATHRDEVLARCAARYAAHPEKKAAYFQEHREERRAYRATAEAREKNRVHCAAYRAAHLEDHRARCADWYKEHRDEVLAARRTEDRARYTAYSRNYHARKMAASGTHTAEDVAAQYERQGGRCFYCGEKTTTYHADHVVPLILGGSNGPENLVIACQHCNNVKAARHPMDYVGMLF